MIEYAVVEWRPGAYEIVGGTGDNTFDIGTVTFAVGKYHAYEWNGEKIGAYENMDAAGRALVEYYTVYYM